MQINFEAKKLQEANEYVNLLHPSKIKIPKIKMPQINKHTNQTSIIKKILKFLFK